MQPGKLKARLSLQEPGSVQDAIGQPIPGFVEVARPWGDIRTQSGLEAIKADAMTSVVKASIRIRRRPGVVTGMRLVHARANWPDVVYEIKAVLVDEQSKDHIDLACEVRK